MDQHIGGKSLMHDRQHHKGAINNIFENVPRSSFHKD